MTANNTGPVLWSVDARGVATVTLNRPEVNNAYNGELIDGVLRGARCAGQPQRPARRRAQGQRQAFPGRRRSEMDRRGTQILARRELARLARDRRRGAAAELRSRADHRAGAGRLLRRRHRHRGGVRRGDRCRQCAVLDRRGALGPACLDHHPAARRCDRRAAVAPLCADRRALRRRGGLPHRARAQGGAARRARGRRRAHGRALLANGPDAISETKAWILRSAWSDLDDDGLHRAGREPCGETPVGRGRRRARVVRRETRGELDAKG